MPGMEEELVCGCRVPCWPETNTNCPWSLRTSTVPGGNWSPGGNVIVLWKTHQHHAVLNTVGFAS